MRRVFTQTFGVVSALIKKEGKILLVRETKKMVKGLWNLPGGWIDVGENPFDTVQREVKEETGFTFKPHYILGVYSLYNKTLQAKFGITPHSIKIVFIGNISKKQSRKLSADVSEIKWFLPEEIYQMDKKVLRNLDIQKMIKDYFDNKRYPLELLNHTVME